MFSSEPFSQVPSSTNVFSPPNSFLHYEQEDNAHFNYHHQINNPFNNFVCPADQVEDFVLQQQDHNDLLDSVVSSYKKKLASSKQRDGHSKIYTARGLRDRRVQNGYKDISSWECVMDQETSKQA
ncbi:hypothetical protein L1987_66012 [Smallanthus sonchifolius]|uniref:Uncharacterized protein n=2 Tax=Smallanthus sonchifolius TaxID=185202 RepID=A0ACB9BVY0_9ASTR|nr:hypothetical protein L1987_66011 [Smallanthus sonchifolius]KAI3726215.1 hypothetical protein L1987_66012 [Smallanthus sonchifolius]